MRLYRSHRTEDLADALAAVLARPRGGDPTDSGLLVDPLRAELVIVPSPGMARWLSMRLAERLGVCAMVRFELPAKGLAALTAGAPVIRQRLRPGGLRALGAVDAEVDPFAPDWLRWRILAVLPSLLSSTAFAPLRTDCRALAEGAPVDRRAFSLAGRIADLFDRYATWRPELLRAWSLGESGAESLEDAWQPQLWRALQAVIAGAQAPGGRVTAGVQAPACRVIAGVQAPGGGPIGGATEPPDSDAGGDATPADRIRRAFVFGLPALPPLHLEALTALGRGPAPVEIHLFVPVPTRQWGGELVGPRALHRAALRGGTSAVHLELGHPLVVGLGRLALDFQQLLEAAADGDQTWPADEPEGDVFHELELPEPPLVEDTLLGRLQADIVELRPPTSAASLAELAPGAPAPPSLRIHACHSAMRQVEVLRDDLLALLAAHPDLQPRDIVVMTPDIEAFAPVVEAVFGDTTREPRLPFQVADRPPRAENPWASALLAMLSLAAGRLPASEVLAFLSLAPLQARFGLDGQTLAEIQRLVVGSGIRWGSDAAHRVAQGQPEDAQNTWRFGLDRLLLGVAAPDGSARPFAGVLPLPGVEGSAVDALGKLIEAWDMLDRHLPGLRQAGTVAEWSRRLGALLADWEVTGGDPGASALRESLAAVWAEATGSGVTGSGVTGSAEEATLGPLGPDAVHALLAGVLESGGGAGAFLAGGITFCALVPMRSIPFQVVCLIGLDDGAFPRNPPRPAFDLMAREPRRGDRSPRDDDRYLFLEALLAARRSLRICYTGFDIRTNAALPPSVVVDELLDVCRQMGVGEEHVCVAHSLQPFSPSNFGTPPRSFDRQACDGARALRGERRPAPPFLSGPILRREAPRRLRLADLVRFHEAPVAHFVKHTLGVRVERPADAPRDREPFTLDRLQQYGVRQRVLEALTAGDSPDLALSRARLEGLLPLGTPGDAELREAGKLAALLHEAAQRARGGIREAPRSLRLTLGGVEVEGAVGDLYPGGRVLTRAALLNARTLAAAWVAHVMWQCAVEETVVTHLVGRCPGPAPVATWTLTAPGDLRSVAAALVDGYLRGLQTPRRLFPATSLAYVESLRELGRADAALRKAATRWRPEHGDAPGDGDEPEIVRIFGVVELDAVDALPAALPAPPGEDFASLALAFFTPVLDARTV